MDETQEKDLYDLFGLDRDNPFVVWFAVAASEAAAKLHIVCNEEKTPALAFNEFVKAWDYYGIMPDSVREECEEMVKIFREMWKDVAEAEAEYFYHLCNAVIGGEDDADEPLSIVCIELLEAISSLDGCIPEATGILAAALKVITNGKPHLAASCTALLYVLCARIWYRSLGLSCKEEEALLSEGLKCHQSVKPGDIISSTELYAMNMAAAIDDIICVRRERGMTPAEMLGLAKEGYIVLDRFDTPNADAARQSLYNSSGISAEMALYGERRYSILHRCGKQMVN